MVGIGEVRRSPLLRSNAVRDDSFVGVLSAQHPDTLSRVQGQLDETADMLRDNARKLQQVCLRRRRRRVRERTPLSFIVRSVASVALPSMLMRTARRVARVARLSRRLCRRGERLWEVAGDRLIVCCRSIVECEEKSVSTASDDAFLFSSFVQVAGDYRAYAGALQQKERRRRLIMIFGFVAVVVFIVLPWLLRRR